ncbi:MAG TPA: carotenoid biosynthesis protein [Caldimonas sp.]
MQKLFARLPVASFVLLAGFLVVTALRVGRDTTTQMVLSSLVMFAFSWVSATHLLGARAALKFIAIALAIGWFAEQMGASRGWFFGVYTYTDVLGPKFGVVPVVIPLMWFALVYAAYVIANLIVWRAPVAPATGLVDTLLLALLGALVVTAYDLGAKTYMVDVAKAWTVGMTDGWYFGKTLEGFFGWAGTSFVILLGFKWAVKAAPPTPAARVNRWHALLPVGVYAGSMAFTIANGWPVETRSIVVFAMGIPVLAALAAWRQWQAHDGAVRGAAA